MSTQKVKDAENMEYTIQRLEQTVLEDKFCRRHIKKRIMSSLDLDETALTELWYDTTIAYEVIVWLLRSPRDKSINELMMYLYRTTNSIEDSEWIAENVISIGICTLVRGTVNSSLIYLRNNIKLPMEMRIYIEETMFLPPIICEPDKITANRSAHLTFNKSSILNNRHDLVEGQDYDHLNYLSNIVFELSPLITRLQERPSDKERSTKTRLDNAKVRIKAAKNICASYRNREFVIPANYDGRGRTYYEGYHINPQGNDYQKAQLSLANKEIME